MSVWKSDEKLLIFAFLISPSKINFLEKFILSIRHSVSSPEEVRKKYSVANVFSTLFSVFHLVMEHCVSCLQWQIQTFR